MTDIADTRTKIFKHKNDKKVKSKLHKQHLKDRIRRSAVSALNKYTTLENTTIELEDHEHSLQLNQGNMKQHLSVKNASMCFTLPLSNQEYQLNYSRDGNKVLLTGKNGHLALMNWKNKKLFCELNLKESFRNGRIIHDGFFAVAQKNFAYIYDDRGLEVHVLDNIPEPTVLEYLPYHFLLCSITKRGKLFYTDVSIGQTAAELKTKIRNVR